MLKYKNDIQSRWPHAPSARGTIHGFGARVNDERQRLVGEVLAHLKRGDKVWLKGAPGVGKSWTMGRSADGFEGEVLRLDGARGAGVARWNHCLADALGVALESGDPGVQRAQLADALAMRAGVLVCVDHGERIPGLVEGVRHLDGVEGVGWLVTHVESPGEGWAEVEVGALTSTPASGDILEWEAARVLEQGATRLEPGWTLGREEAEHAAAVIKALGGNPAALELVGARAPALGMAELARRLTTQTLPSYLDAAFEVWWEGIEEWEQRALSWLSVCRGPFDAQTFEALASGGEGPDVLERLCILRSRSSLKKEDGAHPRHVLPPTIAAFCRRKLEDAGEDAQARDAHAASFSERSKREAQADRLRTFARADDAMIGRAEDAAEAAEWSRTRGAYEEAAWAYVGETLGRWRALDQRGAKSALERARALPLGTLSAHAHATILILCSDTEMFAWSAEESRRHIEEARAAREVWPEEIELALDLRMAEVIVEFDEEGADDFMDALLERTRAVRDVHAEAQALLNIGHRAYIRGQLERAIAWFEESMLLFERSDDLRERARAQMFVGYAWWQLERLDEAQHALQESIDAFAAVGDEIARAQGLRSYASFLVDEDRFEAAHEGREELKESGERLGLSWARASAHYHMGRIALEQGRRGETIAHCARAVVAFERTGHSPLLAATYVLETWARLLEGEHEEADATLDKAWAYKDELRSYMGHATLECMASERATRRGAFDEATELLERVHARAEERNQRYLAYMADLFGCIRDAARLKATKKKRERAGHREAIVGALAALIAPGGDEVLAPIHRGTELRLGFSLLRTRLPEDMAERLETELRDPRAKALLVDRTRRTFRAPDSREWVDMSRRETPYRLLEALLDGRLERPGAPIGSDTLLEAAWPGEEILAEAAANRLYVTLSTLRRVGLKKLIVSEGGGYMLDPDVPLMTV